VAPPATVAAYAEEADLHIVDHIGLFRASSGSRAIADWRVQAEISNEFKEIAVSKKTRVLALAQINREGDTSNWKPPRTKNLAQSDAIGQDSDVVVTMKKYSDTVMTYLLDKNRDGPSDRLFWSRFDVENGDYREITRDQADKNKDSEDVDD
jgi:replicative DNA helicase